MPSQFDNTYHYEYSKPTFDSEEDRIKFQAQRETDYIFEVRPPREPTREEELQYLEW
jgi:hypothetical protein